MASEKSSLAMTDTTNNPQPAKKAGRFKRPGWAEKQSTSSSSPGIAATAASDGRDGVDIFSRSGDTHARILREQEEAERLEKARKAKQKSAQSASKVKLELEALRKKQRADIEAQERRVLGEDFPNLHSPNSAKRRRITPVVSVQLNDAEPPSHTAVTPNTIFGTIEPRQEPIVIDSDDDPSPNAVARLGTTDSANLVTTDDDELQEITDDPTLQELNSLQTCLPSVADDGPDPAIDILIQPAIPETRPLIIKRKYRQKLRDVRKAWCEYNAIDIADSQRIIFTWRGLRLFDVQSLCGMGVLLDPQGSPYIINEDDVQAYLDRITLVATTQAIQDEDRRRLEQARIEDEARARAVLLPPPALSAVPDALKEQTFKIILRSKNYQDQKLIVRASTTVQKIADTYRKAQHIPPEKDLTIAFDGDPLAMDDAVGETTIADEDDSEPLLIDIYVR